MKDKGINRLKDLLLGDPTATEESLRNGYLKNNNLSVEKFARTIGVTRTSVYFYLKDRSRPTEETLNKICKTMGIPLAEGLTYCTPRGQGRQPADD